MTKSIKKKQKLLRRKSKAGNQGGGYAQAKKYWPREIKNRDQLKDSQLEIYEKFD